ncbi:cupin domain-containing protein [Amycolatopsis sp. NPDC004079]|uniref:cupin domain-containing protein n=1 Tax=Amycolatopsis sp. NPDC004079 TaxID=3154549 RepID=UPI0033B44A27
MEFPRERPHEGNRTEDDRRKEHRAPCALLLRALDGRLRLTAAGETVDLRPGGLVHLPPSTPHAVEAVADSRLSLTLPAGQSARLPVVDRRGAAVPR